MRSFALLLALLLTGCAVSATTVRGYHDTLRERLHRAKAVGAMECAPAELAAAQAHFRFASMELASGDSSRAQEHLDLGLVHASSAVDAGLACPAAGVTPKDLLADPWPDADGDSVATDRDNCPYEIEDRDGWLDEDGCPEPDNDGDGLLDRQDDCPMDAEDVDGWLDADGCPDEDNDGDGIVDELDYCPGQPETVNEFQDEDGCPDFRPEHIELHPDHIVFKTPLAFLDNSPILLGLSHAALRELAQLLQVNPDVRILVKAHTDNRGDPDKLQMLSDGRARAVADYLTQQGVATDRIEAVGMADTEPVSTNRTNSGRAQNRRVEVMVVQGTIEAPTGPM